MSETMVVSPIIAALVKSEDILGENRQWEAVNDSQAHFLEKFFSTREELSKFSEKELRSWASWVAAELNKILEEEGFDIRLEEFEPGNFGVVSILDVLVEWLKPGEVDSLVVEGKDYPAVKMEPTIPTALASFAALEELEDEFRNVFDVYTSYKHPHPVVLLHTKSGDKVYMTIADGVVQDFELIARIDAIRRSLQPSKMDYDYLKFPMVDLNQEVDITWLEGIWTTVAGSVHRAFIVKALQQTKFKMNEFGAKVESTMTGLVAGATDDERELRIDQPFFLWIEREGISIPVIYAYITEEDWKDPGSLD